MKTVRWFPVAIAGSTLGLWGCALRTYDFGLGTDGNSGDGSSDSGGDATGPNPTDPTSNPTSPTDPTSNPSDPTTDPTDPTSNPGAPPQLIDVRFLDNLTLQLTFSESMAPLGEVDPSIFRLSLGFGYTEEYSGQPRTFYQEVGYWVQSPCYDNYCYDNCYYGDTGYGGGSADGGGGGGGYGTGGNCYEYCYDYCPYEQQRVSVFDLRNDPADATKIVVQLDRGISTSVCDNLEGIPPNFTGGLFLHYTDDRPPLPVDTEGQGLYPIGEDWVLTQEGFLQVDGFFPQLNPMLPIPCPF